MAKINVIFTRPVRIDKTIYPKSKRSVQIEEGALKGPWFEKQIETGAIVIPAAKAAAPAAAAKK